MVQNKTPSQYVYIWLSVKINLYAILTIHYNDGIMGTIASQITSLTIVYSTVYSGTNQRKHQSSALLAFVWGVHREPVNFLRNGPVTRKMVPFDNFIMWNIVDLCHSLRNVVSKIHIGGLRLCWKPYITTFMCKASDILVLWEIWNEI